MKNFLYSVIFAALVILQGCVDSKNTPPNKGNQSSEQGVGVEFAFSIGDVVSETRAEGSIDVSCPTTTELFDMAKEQKLFASITTEDEDGVSSTQDDVSVNYVNIEDGQIITDPIIFDIPAQGTVCLDVYQVTLYTYDQDGETQLLFSSMHESSPNAAYVDKSCHLSQQICLGQDDIYTKKEVSVCVFCTYDEDAEYFGYIMWNVEFNRMVCFPFSVNICDEFTFQDELGVGTIKAQTGTLVNGSFKRTGNVNYKTSFPAGNFQLADICIVDNVAIPDNEEWYRFFLNIGDRVFVAVISVEALLDYENFSGWDSERRYLHIWLCPGKDGWVLREGGKGRCRDTLEIIMPQDNPELEPTFAYYDYYFNTWLRGIPATNPILDDTPFGELPDTSMFATRHPYKFENSDSLLTYIRLVTTGVRVGNTVLITLYNSRTEDGDYQYRVGPIESDSSNFKIPFTEFTDTIDKECFYVKLDMEGGIQFTEFHIKHDTLDYTPPYVDPEAGDTIFTMYSKDGTEKWCYTLEYGTTDTVFVDCEEHSPF